MAENIINECLSFVKCYFGSVPYENISLVISNFFFDEDLVNIKTVIYDLCEKTLGIDAVLALSLTKRAMVKRS